MGRARRIKRILLLVLAINFVVAGVKIALGYLFAFGSLLSDGFHALSDGAANIVALVGNGYAARSPDKDHPYGYHKHETMASFFIGAMLFVIAAIIAGNAIRGLLSSRSPELDIAAFAGVSATLLLNIIVAAFEYRLGKKLKSEVLISDSLHTRGDIFISIGVLASAALIKAGFPRVIDPLLSLVIAGLVFALFLRIISFSLPVLLDKKALDEREVIDIIYKLDDDIIDIHKFRSRGKKNHVYVDFHLITHGDKTVTETHLLSHRIEDELRRVLKRDIEVIAHIEPREDASDSRDELIIIESEKLG